MVIMHCKVVNGFTIRGSVFALWLDACRVAFLIFISISKVTQLSKKYHQERMEVRGRQ